jgi:N-acetylmuramic acid 6-phosphate (MurNAc-6-P) etherase
MCGSPCTGAYSTETQFGLIEIATQLETNNGVDDQRAVTPLKLAQYISQIGITKSFLLSNINLVGLVPYVIMFPTPATNKDAFTTSIKNANGNQVFVDVDSVSTNGFAITSTATILNLTVFTTYI